jgi:CheY-like chemotaxis protein
MLAYAGRGRAVKESLQVAELLGEISELLRASVSKGIVFDLDLGEVAAVEFDRSQLQQVLMNLLLNGAEATNGSGTVKVALREVEGSAVDWESVVVAPGDTRGPVVEIEVLDRGIGMDAATLGRIFDPFFTTKFTGRGLGLAATLGILRGHGAGLSVQSAPGEGTTFRLYLLPSTSPSELQPNVGTGAAASRPCRVLLVDDEAHVRAATECMLEALGHAVAAASEGAEALARYDAAQSHFDLVLMDLTMPGMDGIATLERLRQRSAELPVVLMSGYTEEDVRSRLADERTTYLSKPFSFDQLQQAIRLAIAPRHRL